MNSFEQNCLDVLLGHCLHVWPQLLVLVFEHFVLSLLWSQSLLYVYYPHLNVLPSCPSRLRIIVLLQLPTSKFMLVCVWMYFRYLILIYTLTSLWWISESMILTRARFCSIYKFLVAISWWRALIFCWIEYFSDSYFYYFLNARKTKFVSYSVMYPPFFDSLLMVACDFIIMSSRLVHYYNQVACIVVCEVPNRFHIYSLFILYLRMSSLISDSLSLLVLFSCSLSFRKMLSRSSFWLMRSYSSSI